MFENELPHNPEELPKDPEAIAKMLGASLGKDTELSEGEEEVKASEAAEATKEKTEGKQDNEEKHERTVPLAALAAERERNRREREAREHAEARAQELLQQIEAMQAGGAVTQEQKSEVDERLAQLREDFPAMAELFESLTGEIKALKGNLAAEEAEDARQAEERAMQEAQSLIDANPTLLYWQTERPELFEAAIEADDRLVGVPQFASLPPAQRFEKAVAMVEALYGKTEVPAEYLPKQTRTNETRERAEKAVKEAGEFTPASLSDLPGGMPPAASELESIERIPAHQLGQMFMNMPKEKMDEYLAKFA